MRPLSLPILLALVLGISFTSVAQKPRPAVAAKPEDDEDVIRVTTTLVTVPVSVMDRQGRFIPDLQRLDFRLLEEGIEQDIAFFETADKPFTVALLLDTSDSTKFKLREIQEAANGFLKQLRREDRVLIIAFDKAVRVLAEATNDRAALVDAISRAQSGGGTSLYDAIELVIGQRLNRISGRKAIVLFTDGVDTSSVDSTFQTTLRAAEELDALAYTIQYSTYDDAAKAQANDLTQILVTAKGERLDVAYKRANLYLTRLADKTGGRSFYAASPKHLNEAFARIAAELRQQYSLGFYPHAEGQTGKSRQLKVRVNKVDAVVRARKTYVVRTPAR